MLEIHGRATVWNQVHYPSGVDYGIVYPVAALGSGPIQPPFLAFAHQPEPRLAWAGAPRGRPGHLEVWNGRTGLFFKAVLSNDRWGRWAYGVVRSGEMRAVSAGASLLISEPTGSPRRVTKASLREISICHEGACAGAVVWTPDDDERVLPDAVVLRDFRQSYDAMVTRRNQPRPTAGLRLGLGVTKPHDPHPGPAVMAKIDAILAEARRAGVGANL